MQDLEDLFIENNRIQEGIHNGLWKHPQAEFVKISMPGGRSFKTSFGAGVGYMQYVATFRTPTENT